MVKFHIMKIIELILIISLFAIIKTVGLSQTTLGFTVGGDYSILDLGYVSLQDDGKVFPINNPLKDEISVTWGIRMEQHFSKKTFLSLSALFSNRKFEYKERGFAQFITQRTYFNYQEYSLTTNWAILPSWYISMGANYAIFNDFVDADKINVGADNKRQLGIIIGSSFRYKGLILDFLYNHGVSIKERQEDTLVFLNPTKSFSLRLSYIFEILKAREWQKSSRTDCPKF